MSQSKATLAKTLTLPQSIGLAITMVVGSGLLVLPGLAYRESGTSAVYAWLISALICVPFLIVFAVLGSRLPGAGGVSGFMQSAFSRRASIPTEFMLFGTFTVGGPAMIITGGHYFATAFGLGKAGVLIGALAILIIGGTVNFLGARVSGRIQQIMAALLVILLAGIAIAALAVGGRNGAGIAPISDWQNALPSVGLVFFALVGWEMMAFTSEEFRNPKRDFPIMIAVSFVIVIALYALVAIVVQLVLPLNDPQISSAPIAALLGATFGTASAQVIALIGMLIILANYISGSWAGSRLIFSSAREGLLPEFISRVEPRTQTPRNAVLVMALFFLPVLALYFAGVISQSLMFQLAGVSFFTLYALSVVAFIKLMTHPLARLFGVLVLFLVAAVMSTFGALMLFPLALLALGVLWMTVRTDSGVRTGTVAHSSSQG